MAALKLPKTSDEERSRRSEALQSALKEATDVPLDVLRVCQQALAGGLVVARNGYRVAASDIATAIELLGATMRGTAISIDGNLSSIRDESYAARVKAEREALAADSARDAAQALDAVSESPRSRP